MAFILQSVRELPGIHVVAKEYRHHCGMRVLSLECADVENMFSVGFSTPVMNDKGTPHIIEHSVLGGSRHFPVKDPFIEMIKGSVATFVNALTYSDHTLYPIASTVSKDFFNLASVYFDALFNPLLTPHTFAQEGWHYELAKPGDLKSKLKLNGVVLNEMTGYEADMDNIVARHVNKALLRQTPRGFESGGASDAIPSLTYAQYRKFYDTHYHPALARVFFYGNIPTEEKLAFLDKALDDLGELPPVPELPARPRQKRWVAPHSKTEYFMPEAAQDPDKGAWAKAFFLGDDLEPLTDMAFEFIDYLLLGTAASPLKKRIAESFLCDRTLISGYDNETIEAGFLVAVNGIAKSDFKRMDALVTEVLREVAEKGFAPAHLESAFTRFKLDQKEITSDYVYNQMEKVFDAWCYDQDPLMFLDNSAVIAQLDKRLKECPDYLQNLIRDRLLENKHVLTLRLLPDSTLAKRRKAELDKKLAEVKKNLTGAQLARIDQFARELAEEQARPNSPEALATLPRLGRGDVPAEPTALLDYSVTGLPNGIRFVDVPMFTNGLVYLALAFPLSCFTPQELLRVRTFLLTLHVVGTDGCRYDVMASRLAANGTAMFFHPFSGISNDQEHGNCGFLEVNLKCLKENLPQALALLQERLQRAVFTEKERLQTIARRRWAANLADIASEGRQFAYTRASAGLSDYATFSERLSGISSMAHNKAMAKNFQKLYPGFLREMSGMEAKLAALSPSIVSFCGTDEDRKVVLDWLSRYSGGSGNLAFDVPEAPMEFLRNGRSEGLAVSSDVSACVRCCTAPHFWEENSRELMVLSNILSCGYLWEQVRVQGGAYGTFASYSAMEGCFALSSSQDPNPSRTLDIFANMANAPFALTQQEFDNAILSTVKAFYVPNRPDKAAVTALHAVARKMDNAYYKALYGEFMGMTRERVQNAAAWFWTQKRDWNQCVIGPAAVLDPLKMNTIKL